MENGSRMTESKLRIFARISLLLCAAVGVCVAPAEKAAGKTDQSQPGELKFVIIVSRHGVRSPTGTAEQLNQYSAQPWPNWDVPPGHLTVQGARLMTLFGGYYRLYFAQQGLFRSTGCADAARVSFYSDSDQRTVETGKSLAAGMFPGCSPSEQSEQHALAEGDPDPLFHSLSAEIGHVDRDRAAASIAGRIGNSPSAVTDAYRPQLEELQRILLGCSSSSPGPQPGHDARTLLLGMPATLDRGKGDHLAELRGPLNTASTITENFLLEYTNGMPMDQVGWGRVDLPTLKRLMDLHSAASDLTRRTSYLATVQASNALAHILDTLQQAASGKEVPGALGKLGDRAVVLTGHDTNLTSIAGVLNLNWIIDGRRDDTPPGGALVFELRKRPESENYEVNIHYTAQTLEQMRNLTPLTLDAPPARANIFIPGCSTAGTNFPCHWKSFELALHSAIDPAFTQ
jgi:4-phytase/acid phosphatase